MKNVTCASVLGGWQSFDEDKGWFFGPVFNEVTELWAWQKESDLGGKMLVKSYMTGEPVLIDSDTPWCCNPASESFWSM